jgi:FkbM family methyltransferase
VTLLHRARNVARRLGIDVHRTEADWPVVLIAKAGVDLVLDVGANRGQYAQRLRRGGYAGAIDSFEPLPAAYRDLSDVAERDPAWRVHEAALGAEDGRTILRIAGNDGASSSTLPMLHRHRAAAPESSYVGTVEVREVRLGSIWSEVAAGARAPLLKLDVQGAEGAVLDGAAECLPEISAVHAELSLAPLYEGAPTGRELLDRLTGEGFRLVDLAPGFRDRRTGELLQADGLFLRGSLTERSGKT